MRIIIDGQPLLGSKSGIGIYTQNLVNSLKNVHGTNELVLVFNQMFNKRKFIKQIKNLDVSIFNTRYPYKLIRKYFSPNFFYEYSFNVCSSNKECLFHATNFVSLPIKHAKTVVTVHDLAFMLFPETTSENIYYHHSKWVPYSAKKATRIIADSENTKKDIIRLLSVPEDRIDVVYLAADEKFKIYNYEKVNSIKEKYQLPDEYILFVGTVEPRKNLRTLIESYTLAKKKYNLNKKLVIVGANGWKYSPIYDLIEKNNLESDIIFTGYIEEDDLPLIYKGASLFTFPSLYEGFGIPILEAFQSGVPVLASNNSSIPEVVGEAGIMVDTFNVEEWAENITKILNDDHLQKRLIEKGFERSKLFSWDKVAKETFKVYQKALDTL